MEMKLSSDKEQLVLKNQRLVYYLVQKMGINQGSSEYDDIVSEGMMGLIKAAITFEPSKKYQFATYATTCINNEIFMFLRKNKKYVNNIYLEEPIGNDGDKEITLADTIEDPESDFVEKISNREEFINIFNIILNCLKKTEKVVILYRIGDLTEREIARKLNFSQSYISRLVKKSAQKIKKIFENKTEYKEVFSMTTIGEAYKISFSSRDITNFNKIFATLLQNVKSAEELPDFEISCNKERIVVQIHAHPTAFAFVANIIQEIDDFSMSFVSNKNILQPAPNISRDSVEDNTVAREDKVEEPSENNLLYLNSNEEGDGKVGENSTITDDISRSSDTELMKANKGEKRENNVKKVREYMLTLSSFSTKELKEHFPDLTSGTIANALYLAKNKGLIISTGDGKYAVKEN